MSANPLVVISTRLAPGQCGIGAHSLLLRKHWPGRDTPFEFVVVEGANGARVLREGDRVAEFSGDAASLARELDRIGAADLLLHYAGRAYHRFGCPMWLPGVLKRWKQKFDGARLVVLLHEVPGRMPITSRHFWLGQLNRAVIRRLSSIADVLVTNTEAHLKELQDITRRADIHVLPIGSNIELAAVERQERARTEFVVFGLPFGRLQVLRAFDPHVRRWHSSGRLSHLHLIGPAGDRFSQEAEEVASAWPASLSVVRHGMLPGEEVSRLLQRARFALTNVTEETWSKSGSFMACATHRCGAVIAGARANSMPLACAFSADEVESVDDDEVERRTAALATWAVQNVDWSVVAARMAALLTQVNANGR
ncbi:MAG TPA: glycosyltransferase [Chthoniobacterales bacterium]|nr:glycosyltransferase [Chthoniobacterales bacterium]